LSSLSSTTSSRGPGGFVSGREMDDITDLPIVSINPHGRLDCKRLADGCNVILKFT
jgi:hypothetical protein